MAEITLTGGCLCGAVRYAATGPVTHETLCHCTHCRGATGAPMVAWITVPRTGFRVVRGEPGRFAASPRAERTFCRDCGTALSYAAHDAQQEIDITTCSLDAPAAFPPRDQSWVRSRLPWSARAHELPAFQEFRPPGT